MKTRVVFFGTPDFSAKFLAGLVADPSFEVVAVIAQPDAELGRKKVLTPPPTKVLAEQNGIPVFQPTKLKDPVLHEQLRELKPDLGVIIAYGRILPQAVIDLMPQGLINVHPSLLPLWRGPSPVQASIAAGDAVSGVSVMKIDAEMDHGPILEQIEIPLASDETPETFFVKVVDQGVPVFLKALRGYVEGDLVPKAQDDSLATYCKLLTRDDGKINWQQSAEEILRKIRAYTPWPGSWTDGFKVLSAQINAERLAPGSIGDNAKLLLVGTGSSALEILEVQPVGGKKMSGVDFLRGYRGPRVLT